MRSPAAVHGAVLLALATAPAAAEVRQGTFASASLGREVSYAVDLPPSYDTSTSRKYPVVYALHGLFEGQASGAAGLAPILARLRESGAVPEFLVVAVDGGNSFFVNAPGGRYEDMVTKDLVGARGVDVSRRPRPEGAGAARGVHGRLRGPARGVRAAGARGRGRDSQRDAPRAHPLGGPGRGPLAHGRLNKVFGDPIDPALWPRTTRS